MNGTSRLKSVDHDSMNGERVGTTSGSNLTGGKLGIWPLVTPENQLFGKMQKFPREGKDLGK